MFIRVVDTLDDNEKKIMTEDEQRTYGNIVSKSARHIGHVMTIGYAALILAHLIKGLFREYTFKGSLESL